MSDSGLDIGDTSVSEMISVDAATCSEGEESWTAIIRVAVLRLLVHLHCEVREQKRPGWKLEMGCLITLVVAGIKQGDDSMASPKRDRYPW